MLKATKNLRNLKPRNGFRGWQYPNTNYKFNDEYRTITDLHNHVRRFEMSNGLKQIENLEDILEDYFCRSCSFYGQFCEEEKVNVVNKVRRVISGTKALAAIKAKGVAKNVADELGVDSDRFKLNVLPLEEVAKNVKKCANCSLNRVMSEGAVNHEGLYKHNVEKAYNRPMSALEQEDHEKLGRCHGCGCLTATKAFLDVSEYGTALLENIHDINKMIKARIGRTGAVCWQLEALFKEEHLEIILDEGRVTKAMLKNWGYI